MFRFVINRLIQILPTVIGITLITFFMIRLIPGDPVDVMIGERGISDERRAEFREQLGLNRPLWEQYQSYLGDVLTGDLGTSFVTRTPVLEEFADRFPATLELAFFAMLFAIAIGIPLGMLAAVKRGSVFDHTVMTISLTGYSMPIFWWGLMLIIFFSLNLDWTPVGGRISDLIVVEPVTGFMLIDSLLSGEPGAFSSAVLHLILPAIVLGTIPLAIIARMTRSSMLEVLGEDYIRTAKAKGLSNFRIIGLHALRNAMIPVITVIGLQVGTLFAGAVLTETIFSWPGVGKWMIEAIERRDYMVLQSGLLLITLLVVFANFMVDILYGLVNPKIRHGR